MRLEVKVSEIYVIIFAQLMCQLSIAANFSTL